jgi:hydroxypyruvate reductase
MDAKRFFTHSLRDPRVGRILAAALEAVEPGAVIEHYLTSNPLPSARRVFALGLGKAAVPMTRALTHFTELTDALVITKHASTLNLQPATIIESGHPVPDARSLAAGEAALEFVSALRKDDLLVCLISGGGSALMTAPIIPLEDMQALTFALLASGARIDEINILRRHLDRVKGGGIARATKARVLSLILSDVVGNPLEAIASGPTAPDPTTKNDALAVLDKYNLFSGEENKPRSHQVRKTPILNTSSLRDFVVSSRETPKPDDPIFSQIQNVIVGDNALAVHAALRQAEKEGFQAESLGSAWQGEAREVGVAFAQKLRVTINSIPRPFCLIAGGETTVTLNDSSSSVRPYEYAATPALAGGARETQQLRSRPGLGGRNQELALAAVPLLAGLENAMLISLASDGEDGPTDATGAVVNAESLRRAVRLGLKVADHLSRHDAYPFFEKLGDLIITGPTGTNVNDLVFLLALEREFLDMKRAK